MAIFSSTSLDGKKTNKKKKNVIFSDRKLEAKESGLPEKKKTLGNKVGGFAKEVVKGIVSPVVTTVARPFQAATELVLPGDNTEAIDKFSNKISKGLIAPVPQNASDVVKDIGRAGQTVLLGAGGAALKGATLGKTVLKEAAIGAGFGAGVALEQGGTETTAKDFAKNVALGGAVGAVAPVALKAVGRIFKGKAPIKPTETIPVETKAVAPVADNTIAPTTPKSAPVPTYNTNIPEAGLPKQSLSTRGNTVAKASRDINKQIVDEGFNSLPEEELAKYTSVVRDQQVNDITRLIDTDPDSAIAMAISGRGIPANISPQILFNVAKGKAAQVFRETGDNTLQRELAKSPLSSQRSKLAQELGAGGVMNDPSDAVSIMENININLEKIAEKKAGKKVVEVINEDFQKYATQKARTKITKQTFTEFVNSIQC